MKNLVTQIYYSDKMENNWDTFKLRNIAEVTMGQSPKSIFYNDKKERLPFLQGNRTFGDRFPFFDTYCTDNKKIAKKRDILLSVRAPVGDLNIATEDICIGRGISSLRMGNENNLFLYYLLKYNFTNLTNRQSGTVFGSINKNDILNLEVNVPKTDVQKKINYILNNLDEKIEMNKKINQNLIN